MTESKEMDRDPNLIEYEDCLFKEMAKVFRKPDMKNLLFSSTIRNARLSLKIIQNTIQNNENCGEIKTPLTIYEWSMSKFKEMVHEDPLLVQLLRFENTESLLLNKMLIDIKNLKDYLKKINDGNIAMVLVELKGCQRVLHILDKMGKELEAEKMKMKNVFRGMDDKEIMTGMKTVKKVLRVKHVVDVIGPRAMIETPLLFRTGMKILDAHFPIVEYGIRQAEVKIVEELKKLRKIQSVISSTHRNIMHFYNVEITSLKNKLEYWTHVYETEYEKIDNEVISCTLQLKNLNQQWQVMDERFIFVHSEIQRILEKIKQEELLKRQKAEEELLAGIAPKKSIKMKRRKTLKMKR